MIYLVSFKLSVLFHNELNFLFLSIVKFALIIEAVNFLLSRCEFEKGKTTLQKITSKEKLVLDYLRALIIY